MEIQKMLDEYAAWMRKQMTVAQIGDYQEITTPYLDRFNDYLQVYCKISSNGTITLTDDGYIIGNLNSSGVNVFNSPQRKQLLQRNLSNYGLYLEDEAICATCTAETFSLKKHMLVQGMMRIDDMFYLSPQRAKNLFVEDIAQLFTEQEVYFTRDFSLVGKTGSLYTYDFHFQRTKSQPERFCKGINKLNESNRNMTIFNWIDTKEKRVDKSELIVILNDENKISDSDLHGLRQYEINPILYSDLTKRLDLFQAAS